MNGFCVPFLTLLVGLSLAINPSLKITVSNDALQYAADQYKPTIVDKIKSYGVRSLSNSSFTTN
jgi:hypothetical protein